MHQDANSYSTMDSLSTKTNDKHREMSRRLIVELENERARSQKFREIFAKADLKCLLTPSRVSLSEVILQLGDSQLGVLYEEMVNHWAEVRPHIDTGEVSLLKLKVARGDTSLAELST